MDEGVGEGVSKPVTAGDTYRSFLTSFVGDFCRSEKTGFTRCLMGLYSGADSARWCPVVPTETFFADN
ncbi:hypothetical protein HanHA300_Chr02g0059501 [Helianthus annuus]|nr:hypothetical protein HanHA300_Chr02g0059501 [Helianthus annuus]KAJ0619149.1 hypothetical protein HanHA89_Chr02g0068061 [Helianthus annuus]KAJ0777598.1 hypothetical protein HanLR1_Chr02g0062261 [Helianthus annuus]KAJ0786627.1 hypothetical protein HanOQP8_Chr02g0073391 [Helianthus annuus]